MGKHKKKYLLAGLGGLVAGLLMMQLLVER